jgi:hypothetical protein
MSHPFLKNEKRSIQDGGAEASVAVTKGVQSKAGQVAPGSFLYTADRKLELFLDGANGEWLAALRHKVVRMGAARDVLPKRRQMRLVQRQKLLLGLPDEVDVG